MEAHISRENMITFLLTTPMFEDLEPSEIMDIIHIVEVQQFAPGEVVFKEGDSGDGWYSIYSGEVEVTKQSSGGDMVIKSLGPRSCFGEIAVLDGLPRSATVRAVDEAVLLRCPQDKFTDLLEKDHLIAYKLIHDMAVMIAGRQRANTETLSKLLLANEISDVHDGIREIISDTTIKE